MNSSIVSIGLSNPGSPIPQAEIARFMQLAHQLDGQERRKLDFLYRKSGIDFRHSVLDDFQKEEVAEFTFFPKNKKMSPFPSTSARMNVFEAEAAGLAEQAVQNALQQAPSPYYFYFLREKVQDYPPQHLDHQNETIYLLRHHLLTNLSRQVYC
jgi:predicted naringenin-chalcone synthase